MQALARSLDGRMHYAWVVVGVTFLLLLTAAGVRATPSVLIVPLEEAFGWSRATTSFAVAVNIFLYGLMGPFAAALMQSIGIRRSIFISMAIVAASVAASTLMTEAWQLVLLWGLLVGMGVGVVAMVLGATIVSRWFATNPALPWVSWPPARRAGSSSSCRCWPSSQAASAGRRRRWWWPVRRPS
jgi:MFS family permease